MGTSDIIGLFSLVIIAIVWLAPIVVIVNSPKTSGNEKLAWVLAMIFISWFAWIFYFLLAPIKKND